MHQRAAAFHHVFLPYLLMRNPLFAIASASRRFSPAPIEAHWYRLGSLLMTLDMWRLVGSGLTELPLLHYDTLAAATP